MCNTSTLRGTVSDYCGLNGCPMSAVADCWLRPLSVRTTSPL